MFFLIWLVVFALAGLSPVDTIPGPTPNRISRLRPTLEEQIVIGKTSAINLHTSRLPNCDHDSCVLTGDISTESSATRHGDLSKLYPPYATLRNAYTTDLPSKAPPSSPTLAVNQAGHHSNRLLFKERQVCFPVCGDATVSPYDTYCCEEGQYCTTIDGTPSCPWSTSAASQAFSSFSSIPPDVGPISLSQTTDLSLATKGSSSIAEGQPVTSSTTPTTVAMPTTSAFLTLPSTRGSSSAVSDSQTSAIGSSQSSFDPSSFPSSLSSNPTDSSGASPSSFDAVSSPSSSSTNPVASSGGDAESNNIALGIGTGFGVPAVIAGIIAAYYTYRTVKLYNKRPL